MRACGPARTGNTPTWSSATRTTIIRPRSTSAAPGSTRRSAIRPACRAASSTSARSTWRRPRTRTATGSTAARPTACACRPIRRWCSSGRSRSTTMSRAGQWSPTRARPTCRRAGNWRRMRTARWISTSVRPSPRRRRTGSRPSRARAGSRTSVSTDRRRPTSTSRGSSTTSNWSTRLARPRRCNGAMPVVGTNGTCRGLSYLAACGGKADISRRRRTIAIYPHTYLSPPAQALQYPGRGKAVGDQACSRLEIADGRAALGAEPAVRLAHVEAAAGETLLQLQALFARQRPLLARPALRERLAAAQPVGEMADRQGIGFGRIVFHDDAEIVEHEEAGTARAGGNQQVGAVRRAREGLAPRPPQPELLPLGDRELARAVGHEVVEALRHHHLAAPALAARPALLARPKGTCDAQVRPVAALIAATRVVTSIGLSR